MPDIDSFQGVRILIDDDSKNSRSELTYAIAHTGAANSMVGIRTVNTWKQTPQKILEKRLPALLDRIVENIAETLPEYTRYYLRSLMLAWMKKDKTDFRAWIKNHPSVLRDALVGAEQRLDQEPALVVAYLTILGLAKLYEGAKNNSVTAKKATDEARLYWERAYLLGMQYSVLTDYLRYRITLWLACVEYNAVDTLLSAKPAVRDNLASKLNQLNVLEALNAVRAAVSDDHGPIFNTALFMTVTRDWEKAAEAILAIEALAESNQQQNADFQARKASFDAEPIIQLEKANLDEWKTKLKAKAIEPASHKKNKTKGQVISYVRHRGGSHVVR